MDVNIILRLKIEPEKEHIRCFLFYFH